MSRKHFQKHSFCLFLLLQFIFWAVCGQGLHLWEHSYSLNIQQIHLDSHGDHSKSCVETHESEYCSICSFYQSLQHTLFVPDMLLNETLLLGRRTFSENRLFVFDGIAGLFLRGPPSILLS